MNFRAGKSDSYTSAPTDQQNKAKEEDAFAGQKLQLDELLGFDDVATLDSLLEGDLNPN